MADFPEPTTWNGPEDTREFSERPSDEDGGRSCPWCDCRDDEGHEDACPVLMPFCACGNIARRYVHDQPTCTKCEAGQRRGAA